MDTERRSPNLSLSVFRVPHYRYFPTRYSKQFGPEQWERLRILQACERLDIPVKLWPTFPFPQIPDRSLSLKYLLPIKPEKMDFPPFVATQESIAEWRNRCHEAFDKYLDEYAAKFESMFRERVASGEYKKIPSARDTTPLNIRYEWAAKRICYHTPYRELADAEKGYSEERVRQSVNQILRKASLSERI